MENTTTTTTKERLKALIATIDSYNLPSGCTAAFHLDKGNRAEINEIAIDQKTVAHHRPNGQHYVNFKHTPKIDIYIWE